MRLTNSIRSAFVRSAMNDVPSVDYDEQLQKAAMSAALASMPPKVRDAYKAHPDWFNCEYRSFTKIGAWHLPIPSEKPISGEAKEKLNSLAKLRIAQTDALDALKRKLHGAANSVSTRKALAELLPEFAKYLPADEAEATRSLPAIANIVTDFVKAGWPKKAAK